MNKDWKLLQAELDVLGPERRLALAYVEARRRSAVAALWMLDATLGAVISADGQPMIRQVKLAWWREALEGLDAGIVPPQPLLASLGEHVLPGGIAGAELARMATGWEHLVASEAMSAEDLAGYASQRGGLLFRFTARLLGEEPSDRVGRAGEGWALADLARHSSSQAEAAAALHAAAERLPEAGAWPRRLRPLGMLAVLARRDARRGIGRLESQGAPRRILRMLGHRLTGR